MTGVELSSPGEGVLQITFARPASLNALNLEAVQDLLAVLDEVDRRVDTRAVILTGAGRAFCAGFDLTGYGDDERLSEQGLTRGLISRQSQITDSLVRLHELPVPVVAAINGPCAGAGLSYTLACDIRIAAAGAVFSAAFLRAGFTACDLGASWLLPRIVGVGRAHELMLTARRFDAPEALRIGLVTDVVPADQLIERALGIAGQIKQHPPLSTLLSKQGMAVGLQMPSLRASIEFENRQQVLSAMTEDQQEAARSFLEKRPPQYANR